MTSPGAGPRRLSKWLTEFSPDFEEAVHHPVVVVSTSIS
jgi:hypothetical protein